MSSPALRLKSTADAQDTFDRLVAKAGVQASASPATKLAALRELTAQQLEEFLDGPIGKPVFDPEWFVGLDPTRPIEHVDRFPSWLESLAIGQTKEEGALLLPIWAALKPEDLIGAAKMAIPDPQLADEIVEAYGITLAAGSSVVANFIEFFSDCLYGSVIPAIGDRDSPPVYVYRFDQKDVYENSPFHGWAFHSLDNAFFTQFPAVAGPAAPASMQATSKAMSQAVVDLVHGSPPWEAYQTAHRVMAFDGENTGSIDVPDRWTRFSSTAQREEAYRMAGERVLEYALQFAAQFALMGQASPSS
jgi:carboxylesterase type B